MSEAKGKRKAGFFAKLVGTSLWGIALAVAAWGSLADSFIGIQKPPLATFLLIGACWPVVWAFFTLCRFLLPMPFELGPRLFELILVGPGHLLAWIFLGKPGAEEEPKEEKKKD
ncbi:MAG: hypothetical protein AB7N76_34320 [Planctomycetota bacterium]